VDVFGSTNTFTTAPAPSSATTLSATQVTGLGAHLDAEVDPNGVPTTFHFEYGPTTAYGLRTGSTPAPSSGSAEVVAVGVNGLSILSTYHYRVVA
jgi:hypothetical protein